VFGSGFADSNITSTPKIEFPVTIRRLVFWLMTPRLLRSLAMNEKERILVVVSASDTFLGRVIRWLTSSPVNHTFLVYESYLWGGWWAAQIGSDGVKKIPANHALSKYVMTEFYEYRGNIARGLHACRAMVGEKYDFMGILGFLLKIVVWRLTGKRIKNPLHGKHEEFCSEFVASVLKAARVDHFVNCDPASVSPEDVRNWLMTNPRFRRVGEAL